MKRIVAVIFALCMACAVFPPAAWADFEKPGTLSREGQEGSDNVPGDVNADGAVDGLDMLLLMKYLAEETDPETGTIYEISKTNAEVTGDGVVDELDLIRLVKYLGGEDVTLKGSKPTEDNTPAGEDDERPTEDNTPAGEDDEKPAEEETPTGEDDEKPAEDETPGPVVETKEETVEEAIPYETVYRYDDTRFRGEPNLVLQEGKDGVKTCVYTVIYTDGVETSRVLKSENVTISPVSKIIGVAAKGHETMTSEETETESIPFETEYDDDDTRYESEGEIVTREGVNGVRTKVYTVVKTDGLETSRTLKSDEVTTQPVNKVISRGTRKGTVKTVTITEEIPFETEERDWPTGEVGNTVVARDGANGEKEIVYKVACDEDGNEVSREKVSETVTKEPQSKVICIGTGISTYEYEYVILDLSPWMHGTRSSSLDEACMAHAMKMAKEGRVFHSGQNAPGESVGGWSTESEAARGVAAHGGYTLAWLSRWGVGCVKVTIHKPNGGTVIGYYACATGGGEFLSPD